MSTETTAVVATATVSITAVVFSFVSSTMDRRHAAKMATKARRSEAYSGNLDRSADPLVPCADSDADNLQV